MGRTKVLHRSLAVVVALAVVAGCSSSDPTADEAGAEAIDGTVTIYSSVPLQGAGRPIGEAIVNGIQLALEQADHQAAGVEVRYVPLDDATAEAGTWTAEAEEANARLAVDDETAVAYLGTFNSGAAAVAIPLLNEAGMAMLSPGNTAVGLTSGDAGAGPGEPDVYYPTGVRNYARIVPRDTVQGAALATVMAEDGCTRVAIRHDDELYGSGLATNIQVGLQDLAPAVVSSRGIDASSADPGTEAAAVAAEGVDCFVYSGITANGAVALLEAVSAAVPEARLYGPDGVAESTFSDPSSGGISAEVAAKVQVTIPTLGQDEYPAAGQQFFADYAQRYNDPNPNPFAIYGYEVGRLILDVLSRASDPTDREAVRKALFETSDRSSVLGTYSIDANGDTTLTSYGVYGIERGELVFERAVR